MPLRVTRRKSTGGLTIIGTVSGRRIRRRAQSDDLAIAIEEAAVIEATILRTEWHGERRGSRSLAEALVSYLEAAPRSEHTKDYLRRIRAAIGDVALSEIDQDSLPRLRRRVLKPGAADSTYIREIVTPLRALLRYAARRRWCDVPQFETPRQPAGRTRFLLPSEADRLIAAAAEHVRPLLLFLIGTGARVSEATELEWRDVDLVGARALLWPNETKNRRRRILAMPPRVIAALANLPHRDGPVFRSPRGPYADRGRNYGGQIKRAWRGAIFRAALDDALTPHDLRHTWATWHWAIHRDLIALREAGGWSSVLLVERYAHLMPAGCEAEIHAFLGTGAAPADTILPQAIDA